LLGRISELLSSLPEAANRLLEVAGECPGRCDEFSLGIYLRSDGVARAVRRNGFQGHFVRGHHAGIVCVFIRCQRPRYGIAGVFSRSSCHGSRTDTILVCLCCEVVEVVDNGVLVRLRTLCADQTQRQDNRGPYEDDPEENQEELLLSQEKFPLLL
jgi:hypothetical protein